jgi:hypothetical protein
MPDAASECAPEKAGNDVQEVSHASSVVDPRRGPGSRHDRAVSTDVTVKGTNAQGKPMHNVIVFEKK